MGKTKGDVIFDIINYVILSILLLVLVYPIYFIVIASLSDPHAIYRGEVIYKIAGFNIDGYTRILHTPQIWIGYRNSLLYMTVGTLVNLFITIPAAYSLSRKDLIGKNIIMGIFVFTMFFGGGLIPTFILIRDLNLYNTPWIMIIMGGLNVYNMIVSRTFFQVNIPNELLEAAKIDGSTNTYFFLRIVIPLSKAIIAVMALYYGVGHWNNFFTGLIYLKDKELYPLQVVLRDILTQNQVLADMMSGDESFIEQQKIADSIKYGVIIVACIPMLILYPFVQRYFVKGVMIGAIKG
ncbi:MAG TPA: carbohydrate ABC transporter permease [Clostridiales bacterium]|nr:carbohydrate ABC transporter permease [Clostridiales bacterium]